MDPFYKSFFIGYYGCKLVNFITLEQGARLESTEVEPLTVYVYKIV
jgi:hypothetical protein